jgi:hypothetical protein
MRFSEGNVAGTLPPKSRSFRFNNIARRGGFPRAIAGNAAEERLDLCPSDERNQAFFGHMGSFHGHVDVGAVMHPPRADLAEEA